MLDPLSPALSALLRELQLCSLGQLRRCRSRVRQLTQDLPAFDSIWLDALVQEGCLTPYQAQILESAQPDRLRVGPAVLTQRLGGSLTATTYQARLLESRQPCTVKLVVGLQSDLQAAHSRVQRLLANLRTVQHPHLALPQSCCWSRGELAILSRYGAGRTLQELLVRRGRYPASVVGELAQQLLSALAAIHACGQVHGEISLVNVRIAESGHAVLVDAGIRPALQPELTPHARLSPEKYDGIAPEQIGSGRSATTATDLYALGCLLWQLLAGRAPFPIADPLGKLAAHQTKRVPDVREYAPDTPPALAQMILTLTARNPADRPRSAAEVLARCQIGKRLPNRRLKSFIDSFDNPVAPSRRLHVGGMSRSTWLAALLLVTAGLTFQFAGGGLPTPLLNSIGHNPPDALTGDESSEGVDPPVQTLALPEPDARGIITLTQTGPYAAAAISHVGPLTIRGVAGLQPVIQVQSQPLSLWATDVELDNVHVQLIESASSTARPGALVLVRAQNLALSHCTWQLHPTQYAGAERKPVAVAWKLLEAGDAAAGKFLAQNSLVAGPGGWLHVTGHARRVEFRNCLKIGSGPWLNLLPTTPREQLPALHYTSITARQSGPLLRWHRTDTSLPGQTGSIEATDCVLDLAANSALVEFSGPVPQAGPLPLLQLVGDGCLTTSGIETVGHWQSAPNKLNFVAPECVTVEGLAAGKFQFAGALSAQPVDAQVTEYEGPRRTAAVPGIQSAEVPSLPVTVP